MKSSGFFKRKLLSKYMSNVVLDFAQLKELLGIYLARAFDLNPGKPVPHADVLQSIIKSQLFNGSDNRGLIDHFLEGDDDISDEGDFDVNILDITSVRNLVSVFKKRYQTNRTRDTARSLSPSRRDAMSNALAPTLMPIAFRMMQQSIYSTRYRLQDTNPFRKRFHNDKSYNIALLVGSMEMLLMKMDNLLHEMEEFAAKTHFIWYLIIYEKLLTINVDVGYMANRIFALHIQWLKDLGNDKDNE